MKRKKKWEQFKGDGKKKNTQKVRLKANFK